MIEASAAQPEAKPAILMPPKVVEPPPTVAAAPPTVDEVRAVDQVFASEQEKTDAVAGLIGLYLTTPWLGDLLADHFRKPRHQEDEDDDEAKPEEHKCC